MQWFLFEQAVLIFSQYFPTEKQSKPFFYHSLRVAVFLWQHGYSEEIQIAGLFHDILEDTNIWEDVLEKEFWKNVLEIVKANSKNKMLPKEYILEDIVSRCKVIGVSALVVKIADVYDNFLFYKKEKNYSEIKRCQYLASLLLVHKNMYDDSLFRYLDEVVAFEAGE